MKGRSILNVAMGLIILGASAAPVFAGLKQGVEVTPDIIAQQASICNGSTTIEINRCLRLNYEVADRKLNKVYRQVMSQLNRKERSNLIKVQRQWINFRDRDCKREVSINRGGTAYSGFLNQCLERKTKQRTAELEIMLNR
ncbi:MAG: lysozyme inhibitor LprI family protein [Oscillatoriaceae cyanobacterium Prado104]|jgi:uncharacterized protein YecT (DUF1311 family)|nr:lysozyme inhibitor LprI family protein [Oscillatoriaceae cyanobacterium Prado104]